MSSRRSRRNRAIVDSDDDIDDDDGMIQDYEEEEDEEQQSKRHDSSKKSSGSSAGKEILTADDSSKKRVDKKKRKNDSVVDEDTEVVDGSDNDSDQPTFTGGTANSNVVILSQVPEMSQEIRATRPADITNFHRLDKEVQDKAIKDLSRLVLFKALNGESIDRSRCMKEAGLTDTRVSSALFAEVDTRLRNCFDFELKRVPTWMEKVKALPKTYKDRYFVINALPEATGGAHSKAIHGVHKNVAADNAVLLMILSLAFCQGVTLGDGSRWLFEKDMYRLLHRLDGNVPSNPPVKNLTSGPQSRPIENEGTPNVDELIEKLVHGDYLLRIKGNEDLMAQREESEENDWFYSMGPRAAMEIGRKQIVYFCAEVLGVEPDEMILKELDEEEGIGDEEEEYVDRK